MCSASCPAELVRTLSVLSVKSAKVVESDSGQDWLTGGSSLPIQSQHEGYQTGLWEGWWASGGSEIKRIKEK